MPPDHLGGIEFDVQLLWSAQSFDSPYQLWRATSSYSRSVKTAPRSYPRWRTTDGTRARVSVSVSVSSVLHEGTFPSNNSAVMSLNPSAVFIYLKQEGLFWGVHRLPGPLHGPTHSALD